jgi:hypothetical protein
MATSKVVVLSTVQFQLFVVAAVVSGKYDPSQPPRVTVSGESVVGHYEETLADGIFGDKKVCVGSVTLCSEMRFRGECIILSGC